MNQIVVIEDNQELLQFIADIIQSKLAMTARTFTSGASALQYLNHTKPSLALIDLQLEDIRGETICQELRQKYHDLPIIILTGDKSTESIVNCLNAGADDYMTKPFNLDELVARINARLRTAVTGTNTGDLLVQDIALHPETFEVTKGGEKVELTAKEFELLRYLLLNKGLILTRDKILAAVWGYQDNIDTRVIDVHIGKLRRKISPQDPEAVIRTMRGFGYKVVD